MSQVHEFDRAFSVVICAATVDQIKYLIDNVPCLESSRDYLLVPEKPEQPFELARGIGVESSQYVHDKMKMIDIDGYVCRWDEVNEGALRAPSRIPGYVGNVFSFVVTDNRVYLGDPPCIWPKTNTTWEGQAFSNHEHPGIGDALDEEAEYLRDLCADLDLCFTDRRFIVEYSPDDRVTFFEPDDGAPIESDEEWVWRYQKEKSASAEIMEAVKDRIKMGVVRDLTLPVCWECGGEKVTANLELSDREGVIKACCDRCGRWFVAATRTIRHKVGNWPLRNQL